MLFVGKLGQLTVEDVHYLHRRLLTLVRLCTRQ